MRAASASPIRTRSSGQRCSCARTRLRRGTPGLARRSPNACSIVSSTVSCRRCRVEARSARAETSLHWPIWRCRSSARDALGSTASFSRAPMRSPGQGSSRFDSRPRKGSRSSTGRSSWGPSQHSGSSARGGSQRPPTSPARSRSRRSRAHATASCPQIHELRPLRGQAASAANILALLEGSAIIEAHRWCDRVQDAYSLRCAAQVHGASRDLLDYVDYTARHRAERGDRQPARLQRGGDASLERELPRPAARVRPRRAGDGRQRARKHLRASHRAPGQPGALRGAAGVPRGRRRSQLGVHDPAVRGRRARQREQGALPSGERRLDPDERGTGGSRCRWATRPG